MFIPKNPGYFRSLSFSLTLLTSATGLGATRDTEEMSFADLFLQGNGTPIHEPLVTQRSRSKSATLENHPRYRLNGFDVVHYDIKLNVDPVTSQLEGQVQIHFQSKKADLKSVSIDAVDLMILSVTDSSGNPLASKYTGPLLNIELKNPLAHGEQSSVTVAYRALRPQSVKLSGPDASNPHRMVAAYTYTQPEDTPTWLPCVDRPDDKATMRISLEVPTGFKALSNGLSVKSPASHGENLNRFWPNSEVWSYEMSEPIAPYLISFAVGPYQTTSLGLYQGKPLELWSPPAVTAPAVAEAVRTPQMMAIFSLFTGLDYPFTHYSQSVAESHGGSMEHQTATTMGGSRMSGDGSGESVVAHELAHQWFGDWVTCRTWGELWLNEGFASYLPLVFYQEVNSPLRVLGQIDGWRQGYFAEAKEKPRALSESDPNVDGIFDSHSYSKGALVIHMMRELSQSSPKLNLLEPNLTLESQTHPFTKALNLYLTRQGRGSSTHHDLQKALEDGARGSYDWQLFFDQWVLSPGHPQLAVTSQVVPDASGVRQLVVQITQTQLRREPTKWRSFTFPIEVELLYPSGRTELRTVDIWDETTQLSIPLAAGEDEIPAINANPRWSILAEISQEQSREQWLSVLRKSSFPTSRLVALRALKSLKIWDQNQDHQFAEAVIKAVTDDTDMYLKLETLQILVNQASSQAQESPLEASSSPDDKSHLTPWIEKLTDHIQILNALNPGHPVSGAIKRAELWSVQRSPATPAQEAQWQNDYLSAKTVAEREAILGMLHHASIERAQQFMADLLSEPKWVTQDRLNIIKFLLRFKTPHSLKLIGEILATSPSTIFISDILSTMVSKNWQDAELIEPALAHIKTHSKDSSRTQALKWLGSLRSPPSMMCGTLKEWMTNPPQEFQSILSELKATVVALRCN